MQQIVDNQQLNKVLESSQQILITCGQGNGLDSASSALALSRALDLAGKENSLLIENFKPEKWNQITDTSRVKSSPEPRRLHISINYPPSRVEKINYENNEGVFELYFSPYIGSFSKDQVSFDYSGLGYDLFITVGIKKHGELGRLYQQYPDVLDKGTVINIDNSEDNSMFGKINLVDAGAELKAQPVYDIIKALNTPLDKEIATLLLIGVMEKTQAMQKEVSSRLLRFGALLLDKEADWQQALSFVKINTKETTPTEEIEVPERTEVPLPEEIPEAEADAEVSTAEESVRPITPLARSLDKEEPEPPTLPKDEVIR